MSTIWCTLVGSCDVSLVSCTCTVQCSVQLYMYNLYINWWDNLMSQLLTGSTGLLTTNQPRVELIAAGEDNTAYLPLDEKNIKDNDTMLARPTPGGLQ